MVRKETQLSDGSYLEALEIAKAHLFRSPMNNLDPDWQIQWSVREAVKAVLPTVLARLTEEAKPYLIQLGLECLLRIEVEVTFGNIYELEEVVRGVRLPLETILQKYTVPAQEMEGSEEAHREWTHIPFDEWRRCTVDESDPEVIAWARLIAHVQGLPTDRDPDELFTDPESVGSDWHWAVQLRQDELDGRLRTSWVDEVITLRLEQLEFRRKTGQLGPEERDMRVAARFAERKKRATN